MIVTGNIKKIMYRGKEISEARNTDSTVWVKKIVTPPPPPKPCETTCERNSQSGCQTKCEKSAQSSCRTSCQTSAQCGKCEKAAQDCGNCLSLCQNNQSSDM